MGYIVYLAYFVDIVYLAYLAYFADLADIAYFAYLADFAYLAYLADFAYFADLAYFADIVYFADITDFAYSFADFAETGRGDDQRSYLGVFWDHLQLEQQIVLLSGNPSQHEGFWNL